MQLLSNSTKEMNEKKLGCRSIQNNFKNILYIYGVTYIFAIQNQTEYSLKVVGLVSAIGKNPLRKKDGRSGLWIGKIKYNETGYGLVY